MLVRMTVGKRIAEVRKSLGLSQAALAQELGVVQSAVGQWETGKNEPSLRTIAALAERAKRPATWIAFGGPPAATTSDHVIDIDGDLFATVGVYDQNVSAGPGAIAPIDGPAEPMHVHMFRKQWLERVTPAPPDQLALLRVRGDSMWDTLHDGDHVLIDLTDKNYRRDSMFVINVEGDMKVKRVSYEIEERRVVLTSDNQAYPPQQVFPGSIEIVGRVIWLGRYLG